jgi:NDP-sugar pyrophosphorylase family protein
LRFVNGYRIVDFVLSNLINSGVTSIYVLAQYKPQSPRSRSPLRGHRNSVSSRWTPTAASANSRKKLERPALIPERPTHAYPSMGNCLFESDALAALLEQAAGRGETDFGRHIRPRATATHRIFAYDFAGNRVTGTLPHEEPNYWRDVGTVEGYRAAQRDASGCCTVLNLSFNKKTRHGLVIAEQALCRRWNLGGVVFPARQPGRPRCRGRGRLQREGDSDECPAGTNNVRTTEGTSP